MAKQRKDTVDSEAGVCVWPPKVWPDEFGEDGQPAPRRNAPGGRTDILQYGHRKVPFRADGGGRKCELGFHITDVVKPLAVVSAIVDIM